MFSSQVKESALWYSRPDNMISLCYHWSTAIYLPARKWLCDLWKDKDVSDEIAQLVVEVSRTIVSSSLTEPVESGVYTNRIEYTP